MLASVGHFGFWTYYLYSGDKDAIKAVYPAVRKYLALYQLDDRGFVVHRPGGWDWFDWGDNIDKPVLLNAWYVLALDSAIAMARLLKDDDRTMAQHLSEYQATRARVADAFHSAFWHGTRFQGDPALVAPTTVPRQWPSSMLVRRPAHPAAAVRCRPHPNIPPVGDLRRPAPARPASAHLDNGPDEDRRHRVPTRPRCRRRLP